MCSIGLKFDMNIIGCHRTNEQECKKSFLYVWAMESKYLYSYMHSYIIVFYRSSKIILLHYSQRWQIIISVRLSKFYILLNSNLVHIVPILMNLPLIIFPQGCKKEFFYITSFEVKL